MKQADSRGGGICLGLSGVVIALARPQPSRVVGIADVTWPHGLWQHRDPEPGPAAVARRMLGRARRQLALPRGHPVSVVIGPSLSGYTPEEVLATSAEVLARAGLSQAWVAAPDGAAALRRQVAIGPGPLGAAAEGEEAALAIGAALASLFPPPTPADPPHAPAAMPPALAEALPITAMPPAPPAPPEAVPISAMPPASPEALPIAAMPPELPVAVPSVVPAPESEARVGAATVRDVKDRPGTR